MCKPWAKIAGHNAPVLRYTHPSASPNMNVGTIAPGSKWKIPNNKDESKRDRITPNRFISPGRTKPRKNISSAIGPKNPTNIKVVMRLPPAVSITCCAVSGGKRKSSLSQLNAAIQTIKIVRAMSHMPIAKKYGLKPWIFTTPRLLSRWRYRTIEKLSAVTAKVPDVTVAVIIAKGTPMTSATPLPASTASK